MPCILVLLHVACIPTNSMRFGYLIFVLYVKCGYPFTLHLFSRKPTLILILYILIHFMKWNSPKWLKNESNWKIMFYWEEFIWRYSLRECWFSWCEWILLSIFNAFFGTTSVISSLFMNVIKECSARPIWHSSTMEN